MGYIVVTGNTTSGRYYLTDTCNKPRVAVKISNSTSYIPMRTTTSTVTITTRSNIYAENMDKNSLYVCNLWRSTKTLASAKKTNTSMFSTYIAFTTEVLLPYDFITCETVINSINNDVISIRTKSGSNNNYSSTTIAVSMSFMKTYDLAYDAWNTGINTSMPCLTNLLTRNSFYMRATSLSTRTEFTKMVYTKEEYRIESSYNLMVDNGYYYSATFTYDSRASHCTQTLETFGSNAFIIKNKIYSTICGSCWLNIYYSNSRKVTVSIYKTQVSNYNKNSWSNDSKVYIGEFSLTNTITITTWD